MPRKNRQLRAELARNGFHLDPKRGKGSHTYWAHPLVPYPVVISGQDGDSEKCVTRFMIFVKRRRGKLHEHHPLLYDH
jgi:predicted RNA binding protein YcfA (HicA-like mRNA interferase family)